MTDVDAIRAAVAGGWCVPPNTAKEMDVELGEAIAQALIPVLAKARAEALNQLLDAIMGIEGRGAQQCRFELRKLRSKFLAEADHAAPPR